MHECVNGYHKTGQTTIPHQGFQAQIPFEEETHTHVDDHYQKPCEEESYHTRMEMLASAQQQISKTNVLT